MPKKCSTGILFMFTIFLILFASLIWAFRGSNNLNKPVQTTSTTAVPTTTTISTKNNSLTREAYLDVKSGEGLLWFTNETISDVRTSMRIWEEKTNYMLKFEEVKGEPVADIVIKFTDSFNTSSTGTKTTGEAYIYLGQIRGKVYILPSSISCRNQVRTIHELGHIIGLNHSANYNSAMHPTESCVQNITDQDAADAIQLISQFV